MKHYIQDNTHASSQISITAFCSWFIASRHPVPQISQQQFGLSPLSIAQALGNGPRVGTFLSFGCNEKKFLYWFDDLYIANFHIFCAIQKAEFPFNDDCFVFLWNEPSAPSAIANQRMKVTIKEWIFPWGPVHQGPVLLVLGLVIPLCPLKLCVILKLSLNHQHLKAQQEPQQVTQR